MQLARLKPFMGPKHYIFKDPDTGREYQATTKETLVRTIVAYREQNELPPILHLNHVLENYWANLPENAENAEMAPPFKRGFVAYIKGGVSLLDYIWYGEDRMVTKEVADNRATICLTCPHNVFPDKGAFIAWTDSIAEASVGDKKSAHYDELGSCDCCSCTLKAKVFYKGVFSCSAKELSCFPEFCWQKSEYRKRIKPKG